MVYNIVLRYEAFAILDEGKSDVKVLIARAMRSLHAFSITEISTMITRKKTGCHGQKTDGIPLS